MTTSSKIMDKEYIRRTLMRIAHEIVEKNKGVSDLCLVGIRTRGAVLAERINECIRKIEGRALPLGILDITLYRDDLTLVATQPIVHETLITFDITGKKIDNEENLKDVIDGASPEIMLQVKQANNAFKIRMRELDNELVSSELGDTQDARKQNKHSTMPAVICMALTVMVSAGAIMLFTLDIPDDNKEIAYLLFGTMLAKWGDSIAYWVGTTRSSANKDMLKIGRV